ncbi:MAG: YhcH/YjgK/YiaL family protein [Tannerella sp.]|jgi:YhcH/YjgK/YiaL family protein|nr:YhcH/YjgK/YiaL family protein [Tannerella sp.]
MNIINQYVDGQNFYSDPSIEELISSEHDTARKEIWDRAFAFLMQTNFKTLPLGRIELGEKMYANVDEYFTKPREGALAEAHRKYIDIQYIVEGNEIIDITSLHNMTVTQPYNAEKDIEFGTINEYTELQASTGRFYIIYPTDAHRPNLQVGNTAEFVRKVVVKVPVD